MILQNGDLSDKKSLKVYDNPNVKVKTRITKYPEPKKI